MKSMMKIQFLLAVNFNFLLLFLPPLLSALFRTWIKAAPHILPKKNKPSWEGDITGLLELTVKGSSLTERDAYTEAFGFATDVMVSTIKGCTIVDMFIVTVLECIMTHSFVSHGCPPMGGLHQGELCSLLGSHYQMRSDCWSNLEQVFPRILWYRSICHSALS